MIECFLCTKTLFKADHSDIGPIETELCLCSDRAANAV